MLNKVLKIIGIALTVIVIGVVALVYLRGESYFKEKIDAYLNDKTNGVYYLEYDKVDVGFFSKDLKIYGFNLQFDTLKANELLAKNPKALFFNIKVKELDALNFDYQNIFDNNIIEIDELSLKKPKVRTYGAFENHPKIGKEVLPKNMGTFDYVFKTLFKEININRISFEDAGYDIYSKMIENTTFSNAKRIDVLINEFHSDSSLLANKEYFSIEDLSIRFLKFESLLGDKNHSLKADTLDFSLKKSKLRVNNLTIIPNGSYQEKDCFKLTIPKLSLQLRNLNLRIFDSIVVDKLEIENPTIDFYKNKKNKKNRKKTLQSLNFYNLIKNNFKEIKVDFMEIKQAKLNYYTDYKKPKLLQKIEELNFELHQFSVDSISENDPNKLLYADHFKIDVRDFSLNLDEDIHQFKVGAFELSSENKNIELKDVSIIPIKEVNKIEEKYSLYTKNILVNNVDFKKMYREHFLEVDALILSNVKIKRKLLKKAFNKRKIKISKLEGILKPIFNRVKAKEVFLENAELDVEDFRDSNKPGFFRGIINFKLKDLDVDVLNFKENRRVLFSKYFDLEVENYAFKTPKDINVYKAKNIHVGNVNNKVLIKEFDMSPQVRGGKALDLYGVRSLLDISVDRIEIDSINFKQVVFDHKLKAHSFQINNPIINIKKYKKEATSKKIDTKEVESVLHTALAYMSQIEIDQIEVKKGEIELESIDNKKDVKKSINNNFDIKIEHFLFNEEELNKKRRESRLFFSDNVILKIENQKFNIGDGVHEIMADKMEFDLSNKSLHIENALMSPNKKSAQYDKVKGIYQISIPELNIVEFDFFKALETDSLSIGKIRLNEAKINYRTKSKKNKKVKKFNFKNFYVPLPQKIKVLEIGALEVVKTTVETYENGVKPILKGRFKITSDMKNIRLVQNNTSTEKKVGEGRYHIENLYIPLKNESDIKVEDLKVDIVKGDLKVENLIFRKGKTIEVGVEELIMDGLDPKKIYFDDFDVKSIVINHPTIKISPNKKGRGKQKQIPRFDSIDIHPVIKDIFNYVKAKSVKINNADVAVGKFDEKEISLEFKDILIDEQNYGNHILHSENIILNLHDLKKSTNLYDYKVKEVVFSTNPAKFLLKNLQVTPKFSKKEYYTTLKNQVDRIEAKVDYISVDKIDILHWLEEEELFVNKIEIGPSEIDIFKDKRVPKKERIKPLPQTLLNKLKQYVYIDSLLLKPSVLNYSEYEKYENKDSKGLEVDFQELDLQMNNITNIPRKLRENSIVKGRSTSLFFGKGKLDVALEFDLNSVNNSEKIKGNLTNFPLRYLNKIIENTEGVRIRRGYIDKLSFNMDLTDKNAVGKVNLFYDSLNIALLDKDNLKERKVLSGVINFILSNDSNKKKEEKDNVIYLEHDNQKSFIGYWWKSIVTGLKSSFGLASKEQREIKNERKKIEKQ